MTPLDDGTMTVRQAGEFSGLSRSRLYLLMGRYERGEPGGVEWFHLDGPGSDRLIVRASLIQWLEARRAASLAGEPATA